MISWTDLEKRPSMNEAACACPSSGIGSLSPRYLGVREIRLVVGLEVGDTDLT